MNFQKVLGPGMKTKRKIEAKVSLSVWEDIIFNRSQEDVGKQRILAKNSKQSWGSFMHDKGYIVYWTKKKFDFLPSKFVEKFLSKD